MRERLADCRKEIVIVFSFPDHEQRVGEIAREMGFTNVSLSHQIIAMQKYVPRAHTGFILQ